MATLDAFLQLSLDGYFAGPDDDLTWAHQDPGDEEWNDFVAGNARSGGMLLFGRRTYDMMIKWWPTPMAKQAMPEVAAQMNGLPKGVFSRTLKTASWNNTRILGGDLATEVRRLKRESPVDMVILGSGSIVAQLAAVGLIDSIQLVVNPVALGSGRTPFEGIAPGLRLRLHGSRAFRNGNVLHTYAPAA